MGKRAALYTLGCKVNRYETEAISGLFEKAGYQIVDFEQEADVYIINTCTVTGLSARKSRQIIRRARAINRDAVVAVIGCYPQTAPDEVAQMQEVDLVLGTDRKSEIVKLVEECAYENKKVLVEDIMKCREFEEAGLSSFRERARAYVKIQDGCSQFCSYCIIPFARGPVRSRRPENIIDEVNRLVKSGFKEIVLTGIHIASYGKDFSMGMNLNEIIRQVHDRTDVLRIRISSIEPTTVDDGFIKNIAEHPKVCPHLHISLQSGCDATLKRMNRRYDAGMYSEAVRKFYERVKDAAVTTDVMVGFPGETEEEFMQSLKFIESIPFMQLHVFKYSPRKGTKAAAFENQVASRVKEERSRILLKLSEDKLHDYLEKYTGCVKEVLIEQESSEMPGYMEGHTDNYMKVICNAPLDSQGEIYRVKLEEVRDGRDRQDERDERYGQDRRDGRAGRDRRDGRDGRDERDVRDGRDERAERAGRDGRDGSWHLGTVVN